MGMSPSLIDDGDFDVGTHGERLKMTDRLIVGVLRALLARTDIIMISGVIDTLGDKHGDKVPQLISIRIHQFFRIQYNTCF